jgi:HPt (histidine-containing phosphotransfer) domain-containing protein
MDTTEYKHINLEYLYEIADNETDFVKEIINDYLSNVPAQFVELEKAVLTLDKESTRFMAHKMKSAFQFMGVQTLVELSQQMEKAEDNDALEIYKQNIGLMRPIVAGVLVELEHKLTLL